MKAIPMRLLAAITIVTIASSALADEANNAEEQRYRTFLSATPVTKEESAKVLFKGSIQTNSDPVLINYEILNGFSDSVIVGIIVSISYNDQSTGKAHIIDLYSDCGDIIPLTATGGSAWLFDGERISKLAPTITLKEIRTRKIKQDG